MKDKVGNRRLLNDYSVLIGQTHGAFLLYLVTFLRSDENAYSFHLINSSLTHLVFILVLWRGIFAFKNAPVHAVVL